jgi:hypothetical protein
MLSSSKELKNIPVSISILHEQEYDNICLLIASLKNKTGKRRAFSERSSQEEKDTYKAIPIKSRPGSSSLKDK